MVNCYMWADTIILANSKEDATNMLDDDGYEIANHTVELMGGPEYTLGLFDRETLKPIDITVEKYTEKFGSHILPPE